MESGSGIPPSSKAKGKPFLLILSGIPSSGKTTVASSLARKLESETGSKVMVVDPDVFRGMLSSHDHQFAPEDETMVREFSRTALAIGLSAGHVVIFDDMNYFVSMRRDLARAAKRLDAGFAVIHVKTPLEKAIEWNEKRGKPIPQSLIDDVWTKFEPPGVKYEWDRPIAVVDPSSNTIAELTEKLLSDVVGAMKRWGKSPRRPPKPSSVGEIESVTRRAMGEMVGRLARADMAPQLSVLRRRVVQESLSANLSATEAGQMFADRAALLISGSPSGAVKDRTVVHVGLFGHVDHGKTAIARCLTEHASTASLDKHPEAQKRGITIDMGFSSFALDRYVVNLVDMPGHFALIRHVVAGANIIDAAMLVIDASDGPGVQTIEHLAVIRDFGIKRLLVVLNKRDLVGNEKLTELEGGIRGILAHSHLVKWDIVSTSAIKNEGMDVLKTRLSAILEPPIRNWAGPFKMLIDHSFPIAGMGTVVTGTILRGKTRVGEELEVIPLKVRSKIRMIQMFGEGMDSAVAGDRVGITLSNLRASDVKRGFVLCSPGSMESTKSIVAQLKVDQDFTRPIKDRELLHVNIGLLTIQACVIPFSIEEGRNLVADELAPGSLSHAFLRLNDHAATEKGDKILLLKLDMPPKAIRIVGTAVVTDLPKADLRFYRKKMKTGKVDEKVTDARWLVKGLFGSVEGARLFVGQKLSAKGTSGTIVSTSGEDGAVIAEFQHPPEPGTEVELAVYRELRTWTT